MKRSKKNRRKLYSRVVDWEEMTKSAKSDIMRKHPKGFRKPGSNK